MKTIRIGILATLVALLGLTVVHARTRTGTVSLGELVLIEENARLDRSVEQTLGEGAVVSGNVGDAVVSGNVADAVVSGNVPNAVVSGNVGYAATSPAVLSPLPSPQVHLVTR